MTEEASHRATRADITFIALSLVAGVVLLYLGRSLTFWFDEWRSIMFSGTAIDYLRPVNEHWSTFPLLLYRITFGIVELRSYLPYLAEVIVLHLLAVAAAYVLVRRRTGSVVATALMIPLLLLGAGSENLFWAFQTGFVGSVAFGLWAIVFIERTGRAARLIASLLLIASLMSSGVGLVFLVVALGRAILDPAFRANAVAVGPPVVAYLVWFSLVGRDGLDQPSHIGEIQDIARFVVRGVSHSIAEFSGVRYLPVGGAIAFVLFIALLIATCLAMYTKRRRALAAGCLLGIVANYVLIGLVRANLDPGYATRSRYVYVVAFLLVLVVADWIPALQARLSSRPYARLAVVGGFVVTLCFAAVANFDALAANQAQARFNADVTRAYIALALTRGDESWVDPDSVIGLMPPVPVLVATIRNHGSPLRDELVPGVVAAPGRRARELALVAMVGDGFRVVRATRDGKQTQLSLIDIEDVTVARDGPCFVLRNAGREGAVTISAPGGTRTRVTAASPVNGAAVLGREFPPSRPIDLDLMAGLPVDVVIPDIGDGGSWQVRLEVPDATGRVSVCGIRVA